MLSSTVSLHFRYVHSFRDIFFCNIHFIEKKGCLEAALNKFIGVISSTVEIANSFSVVGSGFKIHVIPVNSPYFLRWSSSHALSSSFTVLFGGTYSFGWYISSTDFVAAGAFGLFHWHLMSVQLTLLYACMNTADVWLHLHAPLGHSLNGVNLISIEINLKTIKFLGIILA